MAPLQNNKNSQETSNEDTQKILEAVETSSNFSDYFNSLSPQAQRAAFEAQRSQADTTAFGNLVISGKDTDGDGKEDTLIDVYDPRTGKDLYNRSGEADNGPEAVAARNNEWTKREKELLSRIDNGDGYLTVEELDAAQKNARPDSFASRTISMWKNFREEIQGFDDQVGPERGISARDIESPAYQRFRELASRPDVERVFNSYRRSLEDMIAKGERVSGSGSIAAWWNNAQSKMGNDKMRQCFDQAERVLQGLSRDGLEGKWDMHMIGELNLSGTIAMAAGGGPGHYKVELVSHNPNDPIIVIDPWKDSFEIKDPRTFKPSGAVNPWFDHNGDVSLGNYQERRDRQERAEIFAAWRRTDRSVKLDQWVGQHHPDKLPLFDKRVPTIQRPKEYTFSDYLKERWERL